MTVPIVTLKNLADRHGIPVFVKIDVEGFEYQVISGMPFNPRFVSFEFGARHKHSALQCISELGGRGYQFNPIIGRVFALDFESWISAQEAIDWLQRYDADRGEYGTCLLDFEFKNSPGPVITFVPELMTELPTLGIPYWTKKLSYPFVLGPK